VVYFLRIRGKIFLTGLIYGLFLVLFFASPDVSACGGTEHQKTCEHKSGGRACAQHSKDSSSVETGEEASSPSQILTLDAFVRVEQYTCPMHPEVREKKSGRCPRCGMKLVKENFYEVYTCPQKGCPRVSAKAGKCCSGKKLQKTLMNREEYYDFAQLQDEYFCSMHPQVVSNKPGKCPECGMKLKMRTVLKAEEESSGKLSYVCPMHPEETSDKPGNCSRCGMRLKEKKTSLKQKSSTM